MKDTNRIVNKTRRDFISMLGKAGISTAALSGSALLSGLMASRFAQAQSGGTKRFVAIWAANGSPDGKWLPNGTSLNEATQGFEGLQSMCNFRECTIVRGGHGNIHKGLGSLRGDRDWRGDTLDQQLASVISTNTPYQSYALGIQTKRHVNEIIGRKGGKRIPPQNSAQDAYKALFGGTPPAGGQGNLLAQKQSILDINLQAIDRLKNKLGQYERDTLDQHSASLMALEKRLADTLGSGEMQSEACKSPAWNANGYEVATNAPFGHQTELMMDIIINAFACGLTNVMTLQLQNDQGEWTAYGTRFKRSFHNSCHASPVRDYIEMSKFLGERQAYLVRGLLERDDPAVPGTKLIDNTVAYFITDMGNGRTHSGNNGPNLVATRMPGFKKGSATKGGNNRHVIDAVTSGMGLEQFMGTDKNRHKIYPHGGGTVATEMLT